VWCDPAVPGPDQAVDATRRTHLANERTYLAWWRTAVAAVALALAVGRLLPEVLEEETTWPYVVLGAGWGLLGAAMSLYAYVRKRSVDRALAAGGFTHASPLVLAGLSVGGAVLAVLTVVLIVAAA
jgi:uncharacterized membrane protein YidH (DUF202 family)